MTDESLLEIAVHAATEAGELLGARFRRDAGAVESKSSPTDVVSDADRASEAMILETIRSARPDDGIVSEERGTEGSASGFRWVVDPLDGTVNYLFGIPVWAVSIAVHDDHGTLAGVVRDPSLGETFTAFRGRGSELNGRAIRTSRRGDLNTALIATGFAYDARAREAQAERLPRLLPQVRDIRRGGSAALDLAWVACGRLDGYFEAPMMIWDKAAGELLVREAGGVVSELRAPFNSDHGVVAAGPSLHDSLRELVLDSK
jgi:myo-inositol-1(or 4)-monophosphatase